MSGAALPMYDLFTRLRLAGLPLGVDDYDRFVHALAAGFGLPDSEALRRLCRLLWTKSLEEARLLDFHFDRLVAEERRARPEVRPGPGASGSVAAPEEAGAQAGPGKGSPAEREKLPDIALAPAPGGDEMQSVRTVLQLAELRSEAALSRFVLSTEYFPVTQRQMKQSFRHLRYLVRDGPPVELDVRATVDRLTTQELLADPVLMPRRINRAELLLLVDRDGSMVPFHGLARGLEETAIRGGRLRRVATYYFHDCPVDHLYGSPSLHDATPIDDVLCQAVPGRTAVLVVSDAGAARGDIDPERLRASQRFLERLRGKVRRIAWLNPMPSSRWAGTSAEVVARSVPMFEISRRGLDRVIGVLRGRPAHAGGAGT